MITMFRSLRRRSECGAIVMLLTIAVPFLLVPIAGLAVDATVMHIVQVKLQSAVDAAALGSGRLLGTSANITEIAGEFFNANFTVGSRGLFGSTLPNPTHNPTITYTTGVTKTVTVSATANVPTLFMRIFGYTRAAVSAMGQASRRDARIMIVIDRSGSMDAYTDGGGNKQPITTVKQDVQSIMKLFTPGLDEIGLIVFDGTGVVGYPSTTSYSATVGTVGSPGTGGPDTCFWDGSSSGSSSYGMTSGGTCGATGTPDAIYQTGQISPWGGTGTADALSLAYLELQKAHLRDLKTTGSDNKSNAILLFTDGVPSAISIYANDPYNGGTWLKSTSGCTYYNDTTGSHPIYMWVVNAGSPPYPPNGGNQGSNHPYGGNYQLASYAVSSTNTPLKWMQIGSSIQSVEMPSGGPSNPSNESGSGCASGLSSGNGGTGYNWSGYSYFNNIPATDRWGNSTLGGVSSTYGSGNGYRDAYFINSSGTYQSTYIYNSAQGGFTQSPSTAYQWGLAMWDAADNAGLRIRTDANYSNRGESTPMTIQILTIGYSGDGGTDAGLLKRLANDANDTQSTIALPSAWSSQPQGKSCLAPDLTTLEGCMNVIGSILLHLTK